MCKFCVHIQNEHFSKLENGMLRVWWMPQLGSGQTFYYPVATPKEAKQLLDMLAQYDLFQFEHKIKPDYSNAGGLEVYSIEDYEWSEWMDDNGFDIDSEEAELEIEIKKDK